MSKIPCIPPFDINEFPAGNNIIEYAVPHDLIPATTTQFTDKYI